MNPIPIVIVVLVIVIGIIFFLVRNRQDKKELEETIKQDYHKPKMDEVDSEGKDKV